jgi:Mn2+/Fe2+ NRAMP family transporter
MIVGCFKWLTLALFRPSSVVGPRVVAALVAIFGTTISPYLFFWQPSEELEEEIGRGRVTLRQRQDITDSDLKAARWELSACASPI